jgi:hypothetical protein
VAAGNAQQIKKDSMLAVSLAVVLILLLLIVITVGYPTCGG